MDLIRRAQQIAVNPASTRWTAPLQLISDAGLSALIVWKVPYTEIDWTTYMQHIRLFLAGERDYAKLTGATGPLVYPAAHVYIYRVLHAVTDGGADVFAAQLLFAGLYLLTLAVVLHCYRRAGAPPWLLPLLSASKRVHSIFMLRMFNDGFAALGLWAAIWCYQRRFWTGGTVSFALGLGVKMSVLLALPAVGLVLWQGVGRNRAVYQAQWIAHVQLALASPFLLGGAYNYATRAFEFSRVFMFKWTVNWRFVGEERFLSRPFSYVLIGVHLFLLYMFGLSRWLQPSGWTLPDAVGALVHPPPPAVQTRISRRVTPDFVLTSMLSAVIIGCLCARSLHYQFFVYISWATPYLLWRSGMHPLAIYAVCAGQEWAWNVYPSTNASSAVVVACLAMTVGSIWIGTSPSLVPDQATSGEKKRSDHEHAE